MLSILSSLISGTWLWWLAGGVAVLAVVGAIIGYFTGKLQKDLVIGIIIVALFGGIFAVYEYDQSEIQSLTTTVALEKQSADDMAATMKQMQQDLATVQKEEANTSASISKNHVASTTTATKIKNQKLTVTVPADVTTLQNQINTDTANMFKGFEDSTK